MMPLHLLSLCLYTSILASYCTATTGKYYGALWCHQGGTVYSPGQCEPSTLDCFKFVCNHTDAGFVARGCGVSVSRTASGLPKESCNQALATCQQVGGHGICSVCNDVHMCNLGSGRLFTFLPPLLVTLTLL